MRRLKTVGAAVLCVAAAAGFGSVSTSSAAGTSAAQRSAAKCADGHSITAKLGAHDFALLKRFVVCLGKQWAVSSSASRPSGEGGFDSLGGIPGVVRAINGFANDPKRDETASFVVKHLGAARDSAVGNLPIAKIGCFWYAYGDTSSPAPSLTNVAGWVDYAHSGLVAAIGSEGNWLNTTAVVEKGSWFHDGSKNNVRYAVVFLGGSLTGNSDCSK